MYNINKYLLQELFLVGLSTLATLIGPTLWINAKFSVLYVFPGLVFSGVCIGISTIIYKAASILEKVRLTNKLKFVTGIIVGYLPFAWLIVSRFKDHPENLFRISRGDALLSFPFIVGFLVLSIILLGYAKNKALSAIYKVGMLYLLPLYIVIMMMPLIPNSEGKVIFGNVAIIYFFTKILLKAVSRVSGSF